MTDAPLIKYGLQALIESCRQSMAMVRARRAVAV
jgi:hypothetical protein